jgi:hypothetical protein
MLYFLRVCANFSAICLAVLAFTIFAPAVADATSTCETGASTCTPQIATYFPKPAMPDESLVQRAGRCCCDSICVDYQDDCSCYCRGTPRAPVLENCKRKK